MAICVCKSLRLIGRQAKKRGGGRDMREIRGKGEVQAATLILPFNLANASVLPILPISSSTLPCHASFLPSPYPLILPIPIAASTLPPLFLIPFLSPSQFLLCLSVSYQFRHNISLPLAVCPNPPIPSPVNLLSYYPPKGIRRETHDIPR